MTSLWSSGLLTRYNPSEVSTCIQFRSIPINTAKTNSPSHLLPNKQNSRTFHTMWIYRHTLPKMHTGVSGLSLSLVHSQWLKFCFYFFFTTKLFSEDIELRLNQEGNKKSTIFAKKWIAGVCCSDDNEAWNLDYHTSFKKHICKYIKLLALFYLSVREYHFGVTFVWHTELHMPVVSCPSRLLSF